MKQVVIISGKGGTGKTVLSSSFVVLFSEKVKNQIITDCDVDAPNLHILLDPKKISYQAYRGAKIAVKGEGCTECGICEEVCRFGAIKNFEVVPLKCEGCGACALACPENVLTLQDIENSDFIVSSTEFGCFVHGKLYPGAENTGGLITLIRQTAERIAQETDSELILMDGAPGIGCQVIASLVGTDLAVIVTEPTFSGMSDMTRALELCESMRVPAVVCINKYNINEKNSTQIREFCDGNGIPIVGDIPFDENVPRMLSESSSPIFKDCPASRAMYIVWQRLYEYVFPDKKIIMEDDDKMKIAVTVDGNEISSHFGHCTGYAIYDVEDSKVLNKTYIENPGHEQCVLPDFLANAGISVVITGGMGMKANQIFTERGIKTFIGVGGNPDDAVELYMKGKLESTDVLCNHEQHS
jgi:MinD superfamily P-loop ATPase/predicted Fe-Mo cluster-binding NifX family protein